MLYRTAILLPLLFILCAVSAQDTAGIVNGRLVSAFVKDVDSKASSLDQKLDRRTAKALQQWQKQESRIKRKLVKTDSVKAAAVFGNFQQQYQRLEQKLQNKTSIQQYIPSLDTLGTSLKFLQQNPQLLANVKGAKVKLNQALSSVNILEGKFQNADEVKRFIKERKQLLKSQLGHLGFAKELKNLNKQAYYYSEQLNEYKALLKDHTKAERKALALLGKSKLFNNFMRKNSMLASLFRLPGDPDNPSSQANLVGLQTRAQVNGLIQQQITTGGPTGQQQFQQNIESAQAKMNELKNKIIGLGGASSEAEIPEGFKPNNQKTKNFFRRLEVGTNIQSQKANGFFPTTSDIGLSLGYKLNDKSIIGIGGSYKLGWGQNIRHINITHQGVGVRSFVDWKIKGSFWLSGGYEMNYRTDFENIDVLKDLSAWQKSGLVGLSKVVSLKTKFFKKTKLQLMWDFLSYSQVPKTQPVVFRVGYNLK